MQLADTGIDDPDVAVLGSAQRQLRREAKEDDLQILALLQAQDLHDGVVDAEALRLVEVENIH